MHTLNKREHDILNPRGVNVIRDFRADGRGIRVWGARTMSSDAMWKYVNVRRLFIFVEESIDAARSGWCSSRTTSRPGSRSARRSPNFLRTVWRNGALMGTTQDEAFFVKCDRTTMTQDDIDNGRLICLIGIAPVKPAEFVIFRICQKTLEAEAVRRSAMASAGSSNDPFASFNFIVDDRRHARWASRRSAGSRPRPTSSSTANGSEDITVRKLPGKEVHQHHPQARLHADGKELWAWRKTVMDGKTAAQAAAPSRCSTRRASRR